MDGGAEVMTDYQMRTIFDLISTVVEKMLKDSPEKTELLEKLEEIRDGKKRDKTAKH